eukprot:s2851_g1.t1
MAWTDVAVYGGLHGLGLKWDAMPLVRDRLKDLNCVMIEKPAPGEPEVATTGAIGKTHSNLRYNAEVMKPVLHLMRENRDKSPCKEALCNELQIAFEKARLQPDSSTLSEEAWSIRYMYGLVKQLTYKPKPPRDTWPIRWTFFLIFFLVFRCCFVGCLLSSVVGVTINKDPLFRELLTIWGVDCADWKPVARQATVVASPVQATSASEAGSSPASTTPVSTSSACSEKGDAKDRVWSRLAI